MKRALSAGVVLPLAVALLFATSSCARKTIQSDAPVVRPGETDSQREAERRAAQDAEAARKRAIEEERLREEALKRRGSPQQMSEERARFVSEDIQFDFDSAFLTSEAQETLRRKADWLRDNPEVRVLIEGHCDERGTQVYNLALGDRRAHAARIFLQDLGIGADRLRTISYGEERPLDPGQGEEAWARNRRAHFVPD